MPTYDYHCKQCEHTQQIIRPINEPEPSQILCEKCSQKMSKKFHANPTIFKGNGWAHKE